MSVLKIRCSDGLLVEVDLEVAKKFGTLKDMLFAADFQADQEVPLKNVSSKTLEKIVKFVKAPEDKLDKDEFFGSDSIQALDLMISADFLNVPKLMAEASSFMAEKIKAGLATNFTASGYCKENLCLKCRTPESQKQLKTCQKCLLATYCSKSCQAADWPDHKAACKEIKTMSVITEKELNSLRSKNGMENVFEQQAGHFWGLFHTRDYCLVRKYSSDVIYKFAAKSKSPKALKASLDHIMELLRLIHSDNMGLRNSAPFLMLDLDHDEDAYNFVKWWLTIDPDGEYDWAEVPESQPGEWLYLRDQDTKEDLVASLGTQGQPDAIQLAVIVLIKARLISKAQEVNLKGEIALKKLLNESSKPLGQVKHAFQAVKNHLALLSDQELVHQNCLLDKYLGILHSKNLTLLKAVINPGPLMSREAPEYMSDGSPEEAYSVLERALHLFQANSLLMTKIRQLVGPKPNYPTESNF